MLSIKPIFIIILLFIAHFGFSQLELGLKGGFTKSWPGYGDVELPEGAQTDVNGYNISIFTGLEISNGFGVNFNPGFTRRGAACFPGWQPQFNGDSRVFLNYFDLPVMIFKRVDLKFIEIIPSVGYGINILKSAFLHQDLQAGEGVIVSVEELDVGSSAVNSYNRYDHGFHLNLKIQRNLFKHHFIFIEMYYLFAKRIALTGAG